MGGKEAYAREGKYGGAGFRLAIDARPRRSCDGRFDRSGLQGGPVGPVVADASACPSPAPNPHRGSLSPAPTTSVKPAAGTRQAKDRLHSEVFLSGDRGVLVLEKLI